MKLPRPYIPIDVRLEVIGRQAREHGLDYRQLLGIILTNVKNKGTSKTLLDTMLRLLFGVDAKVHLDHDPSLQNRRQVRYSNGKFAGYNPPANDPDFLIYRTAAEHKIKTLVRGDGAQHSDAALARKNKRIVKNRDPKRRKYKWPKRKMGRPVSRHG